MLKKRKNFNEEEYFKQLEVKMKKREIDEQKARSKEYENWLVRYLDEHEYVSNALCDMGEYIDINDFNNTCLLSDYWDYKDSETKYTQFPCSQNESIDDLFIIESDKEMQIEIQGKIYNFSREAGLGCYVYTIQRADL